MLQHSLGVHIAGHQQQHVARLIPAAHIGPQVVGRDGAHRILITDDGPSVDGIVQGGSLEAFKQAAHGLVLVALQLGDDHFLFGLQLLGVQRSLKGHFLDHVHASAPVGGGHIRNEPGFVKTCGRVEVAAQGFHILGYLPFGPVLRALEDHMLQQVADAGLGRRFIGGTRTHIKARGRQGEAGIFDNADRQPVRQPGKQHVLARCGLSGRRGRRQQQKKQC